MLVKIIYWDDYRIVCGKKYKSIRIMYIVYDVLLVNKL